MRVLEKQVLKIGPDSIATFNFPRGCVIDYDDHRLYVVDYNNHAVRIIHLSEITGMNSGKSLFDFEISPNPAGDEFWIYYDSSRRDMTIHIFNQMGKPVKEIDHVSSFPARIDISDLEAGIYYIALVSNGIPTGTKKIIKF